MVAPVCYVVPPPTIAPPQHTLPASHLGSSQAHTPGAPFKAKVIANINVNTTYGGALTPPATKGSKPRLQILPGTQNFNASTSSPSLRGGTLISQPSARGGLSPRNQTSPSGAQHTCQRVQDFSQRTSTP